MKREKKILKIRLKKHKGSLGTYTPITVGELTNYDEIEFRRFIGKTILDFSEIIDFQAHILENFKANNDSRVYQFHLGSYMYLRNK